MLLGRPVTLWFYSQINEKKRRESKFTDYAERIFLKIFFNIKLNYQKKKEVLSKLEEHNQKKYQIMLIVFN